MLRELKGTQRLPRVLAFKVNGSTPAILQGANDATLTDNGAGDWTLTFTKPFARAPICVATGVVDQDAYAEVSASATAVQVKLKAAADDSAVDGIFHLIVMGSDADEET